MSSSSFRVLSLALVVAASGCWRTHQRAAATDTGPDARDSGPDAFDSRVDPLDSAVAPPDAGECDLDAGAVRVARQSTTFDTLVGFEPTCDGRPPIASAACSTAVHRYCADRGCARSGYGPIHAEAARADVVCLDATVFTLDFLTAATHHPACDGGAGLLGLGCRAAYHRFCESEGFATGYGAATVSASAALVACLDPSIAVVVTTSYSELRMRHPACDGTSSFYGVECNEAIDRYCRDSGFHAGFGPVERNSEIAIVGCLVAEP